MAASEFVPANRNRASRGKIFFSGKDVQLIALTVFSYGERGDFKKRLFGAKSNIFEQMVTNHTTAISDTLYGIYVKNFGGKMNRVTVQVKLNVISEFSFCKV